MAAGSRGFDRRRVGELPFERVGPGPLQLKGDVCRTGYLSVCLPLASRCRSSEACNHGGGNGSTGTRPARGSTGTGNSSGQAGTGSGNAGTSGAAGHRRYDRHRGHDDRHRQRRRHSRRRHGDAGTAGGDNRAAARARPGAGGMVTSLEMIDNLEDNDRQIIAANGRQGPWHSFNDSNGGNIQPPLGTGFVADRRRREQHRVRRAHDRQRLPVRRRRLRSEQRDDDARGDAEHGVQRQRVSTASPSGRRAAARCASSSRCARSSRPTAAARARATAGTCYGANTPTLTSNWTQITIMFGRHAARAGRHQPRVQPVRADGHLVQGPRHVRLLDRRGRVHAHGRRHRQRRHDRRGRPRRHDRQRGHDRHAAAAAARPAAPGRPAAPARRGSAARSGRRHQRADAPADHQRRHERLGLALLGLLQARLRLDRQHRRQDADQELQHVQPAALRLRRQERLRGRRPAYMCWNGAPWQVGPNLSYGFVAASGSNYSCGRCYQIQFTGSGHNGAAATPLTAR